MSRPQPSGRRLRPIVAATSGIAIAIAGVGLTTLPATASPAPEVPPASAAPDAAAGTSHSVTLLTGDRVTVTDLSDGTHAVSVDTAVEGAGVRTYEAAGDLHVVPDAAMPYLAAGALDEDLFNVSLLIEYGYDDASVDATPVIVEQDAASARTFAAPVPGLEVQTALESIGAVGRHARPRRGRRRVADAHRTDRAQLLGRTRARGRDRGDPPRRQGAGHARLERRLHRRTRGMGRRVHRRRRHRGGARHRLRRHPPRPAGPRARWLEELRPRRRGRRRPQRPRHPRRLDDRGHRRRERRHPPRRRRRRAAARRQGARRERLGPGLVDHRRDGVGGPERPDRVDEPRIPRRRPTARTSWPSRSTGSPSRPVPSSSSPPATPALPRRSAHRDRHKRRSPSARSTTRRARCRGSRARDRSPAPAR